MSRGRFWTGNDKDNEGSNDIHFISEKLSRQRKQTAISLHLINSFNQICAADQFKYRVPFVPSHPSEMRLLLQAAQ